MTTFGTLQPDGNLTNVRVISQADLLKCPYVILVPSHYRPDNTCRCNDVDHVEMEEWGYGWHGERWISFSDLESKLEDTERQLVMARDWIDRLQGQLEQEE